MVLPLAFLPSQFSHWFFQKSHLWLWNFQLKFRFYRNKFGFFCELVILSADKWEIPEISMYVSPRLEGKCFKNTGVCLGWKLPQRCRCRLIQNIDPLYACRLKIKNCTVIFSIQELKNRLALFVEKLTYRDIKDEAFFYLFQRKAQDSQSIRY